MQTWDTVWLDVNVATMATANSNAAYGQIHNAALAIKDGMIAWLGPQSQLPSHNHTAIKYGNGAWLTPGLIDCHTHLIYGGDRIDEFEMRLNGSSYEEIAKCGGGILSTVKNTRAADQQALCQSAAKRLKQMVQDGVTTIEIKSGYGLNTETELRMLRAAKQLDQQSSVDVITTFLGAHALPLEYSNDTSGYIDLICKEMIPRVASENLATAVDAFCESIAFSPEEIDQVFRCAQKHQLAVKLHADQLSDLGGGSLAARYKALSADHIEYLNEDGVKAMAKSGTVAVLLPGAYYALGETQEPPIALLRKHGVAMAVATDSNPGTSPVLSLRAMINMACILFKLTPEESLAGVTREAAKALGLSDRGTIEVGKVADFVLWDIQKPAQLALEIGGNRCQQLIKNGQVIDLQ